MREDGGKDGPGRTEIPSKDEEDGAVERVAKGAYEEGPSFPETDAGTMSSEEDDPAKLTTRSCLSPECTASNVEGDTTGTGLYVHRSCTLRRRPLVRGLIGAEVAAGRRRDRRGKGPCSGPSSG